MSHIELSSAKFVIKSILRKTKASVLKDFKVGDVVIFTIELYNPGRGNNGIYATQYTINNLTQDTTKTDVLSSIEPFFTIFELEKVNEIS